MTLRRGMWTLKSITKSCSESNHSILHILYTNIWLICIFVQTENALCDPLRLMPCSLTVSFPTCPFFPNPAETILLWRMEPPLARSSSPKLPSWPDLQARTLCILWSTDQPKQHQERRSCEHPCMPGGCKSPLLWQMLDLLKIFESLSSDAAVWNELWIQSSGTRDKAATYFLEGLYPMCMKHTPVEPVAWCQCSLRNPTGNLTVARGWTWNGFKFVQLPNHQELLGWNHPNASIEPRKKKRLKYFPRNISCLIGILRVYFNPHKTE